MAHDPLCRNKNWTPWTEDARCPICDEYARIRDDERERIAQEIEAQADDFGFDEIVRAGDDLKALRDVVKDAIHDAARIARGGAQ